MTLLIVALLGYWAFGLYMSVVSKVGSASLTWVADRHAGDRDVHTPVVVHQDKGERYTFLGVPSGIRGDPYEWIILDATPGWLVMKRPYDGHFAVKCAYLADLERQVSIHRGVRKFLSDRCRA